MCPLNKIYECTVWAQRAKNSIVFWNTIMNRVFFEIEYSILVGLWMLSNNSKLDDTGNGLYFLSQNTVLVVWGFLCWFVNIVQPGHATINIYLPMRFFSMTLLLPTSSSWLNVHVQIFFHCYGDAIKSNWSHPRIWYSASVSR